MLTLQQMRRGQSPSPHKMTPIPKTLIQFWHDSNDVPPDVSECLETWNILTDHGFDFRMFNDASAEAYVAARYGQREVEAFARCRHPAMRSDYLRMCFVLAEGGLYVDADDVFLGECWTRLFSDGKLKIQALCYDTTTGNMLPPSQLRLVDLRISGRIFYVNNNPLAAPAGHPVLRLALARSTEILLGGDPTPEIQSTTGPGNLTAALVAHARDLEGRGASPDFELLLDWDKTAETRWDLSYRNDSRNWRNMDAFEG
jgi:hypothetical protein